MAYADATSLAVAVGGSVKLIQLTDDDANGVADPAVITAIIDEATTVIDSFTGYVFGVPIPGPPASIVSLCNKMAARIARRRRNMPLISDEADDKVDREWLAGVRDGKITLGVQPEPPKSELQIDGVGTSISPRDTARERLKGSW